MDLRQMPMVTIDGETARDFDDGVCLEKKPGGSFTLYVSIADVSHYVTPGSPLDKEADLRGTSVYFPQRAVHMLPEKLATNVCSLIPGEDRLAVTAILTFDRRGRRKDFSFARSVVRNHARLTYRLVDDLLVKKDRQLRSRYRPFVKMLTQMTEFCDLLRERRAERGSLLLSLPEAEVVLDDRGWPVDVRRVDHLVSHQLIEEFMIAANEAVATFLGIFPSSGCTSGPTPSSWPRSAPIRRAWGSTCPRRSNATPGSSGSFWTRCVRPRWPPWCSSCFCVP